MVRYLYGYHSNVLCGKRQKEVSEEAIPCILETQGDVKTFRMSGKHANHQLHQLTPKNQGLQ
jgi:hypothetical protein